METINNIANAASKAIWGTHEEPVSGRMGNVAAGQPYDAGNIESTSTALKTTDPNPEIEVDHVEEPDHQKQDPATKERSFNTSANSAAPEVALPPPTPSEIPSRQPPTTTTAPAATAHSSHLPGDSTKAQNDTRSPSDPATSPSATHAKTNIDDADGGLDVSNNPVKIDGPGPRPLEEVAKERGGDAGNIGNKGNHRADSVSTQEDDDRKDSGTGELYVRSSGLAADGGDFDATKPGAGREADRLLEEKGVHFGNKTGNDGSAAVGNGHVDKHHSGHHGGEDHHGTHEKTSLKDKIKAKLHRKSVS